MSVSVDEQMRKQSNILECSQLGSSQSIQSSALVNDVGDLNNADSGLSATSVLVSILLLASVAVFNLIFVDRIPLGNGFGCEPAIYYKAVIIQFDKLFFGHMIDTYTIQRVLPYAIVHYVIGFCKLPFTEISMLNTYNVYQFTISIIGVVYWFRLARIIGLNRTGYWFGFAALFVNFATLKMDFYNSATQDRSALIFGLISFYYYVAKQPLRLFITAVLSLAVWPTSLPYNILLLLFDRESKLVEAAQTTRSSKVILVLACLGLLAAVSFAYVSGYHKESTVTRPDLWMVPLNLCTAMAYLVAGLYVLISRADIVASLKLAVNKALFVRVVMVCGLVGFYFLLTKVMASHGLARFGPRAYFVNVGFCASTFPFVALVGHATYLGPAVALIAVCYSRYCHEVRKLGLGAVLALALAICQSVNSETRQILNVWPIFVAPCAIMAGQLNFTKSFTIYFLIVSFICSLFWLRFNVFAPADPTSYAMFPCVGNLQSFPAQIYFMNLAPWMSNIAYLMHGVLFCVLGLWLWRSVQAKTKTGKLKWSESG